MRPCGCPCRGRPAPSFGTGGSHAQTLTIVNSVYHLLTAVNLRRLSPAGEGADLLVTDATPACRSSSPGCGRRGFSPGCFRPGRGAGPALPHGPEEAVAQCFSQGEALAPLGPGGGAGARLQPGVLSQLRLAGTAAGLPVPVPLPLAGGRPFPAMSIDFARPDRAAVNRHPQGARLGEQVQAALLYEPALAMRGDSLPNRPLPKLSPGDGELLALLNFIFQYRRPPWLPPFLFLEQFLPGGGHPGQRFGADAPVPAGPWGRKISG